MSRSTAALQASAAARVPSGSGELAQSLVHRLSLDDFRTGRWLPRLMGVYLDYFDRAVPPAPASAERMRPSATSSVIRRACDEAFFTGAASGAVATGATVFIAETSGLAGLAALPVEALAIASEMVLRTLIHLRLTCDLANDFGVRFRPDEPWDVSRLYALIFESQRQERPGDPGQQLVGRLLGSGEELAKDLGSQLLGESIVRNVLPFVGVLTSSVANWRRTRRVGEQALAYVRYRRALSSAVDAVRRRGGPDAVDLLLEGLWFIFVADGELDTQEAATLANLIRGLEPPRRLALIARMVQSAEDWLARLKKVPARARKDFLAALDVAAAVDLCACPEERRLLQAASRTLAPKGRKSQVDALMDELREKGIFGPAELAAMAAVSAPAHGGMA